MISPQELRRVAREKRLALDLVEKDYVLGWMLYGIASGSLSKKLAFKGGSALSKVYFPGQWRLSEDLDFTILGDSEWDGVAQALKEEIPELVEKASGIPMTMRKKPFTNPQYLQGRLQYRGPVSMNTVKLEISREMVVGEVVRRPVPQLFDYPRFSVTVYTLENILAEKIRALVERGKAKDYYDVWRLLKMRHFKGRDIKNLVLKKCESKDVKFTGLTQIFPDDLPDVLKPHMKRGLTRLSAEPLPDIEMIVAELKDDFGSLLD